MRQRRGSANALAHKKRRIVGLNAGLYKGGDGGSTKGNDLRPVSDKGPTYTIGAGFLVFSAT